MWHLFHTKRPWFSSPDGVLMNSEQAPRFNASAPWKYVSCCTDSTVVQTRIASCCFIICERAHCIGRLPLPFDDGPQELEKRGELNDYICQQVLFGKIYTKSRKVRSKDIPAEED